MSKILIGLNGLAGSGKTTVARQLTFIATEHGKRARVISFATPLREILYKLMVAAGVDQPDDKMADPEKKTVPIPELMGKLPRDLMQ